MEETERIEKVTRFVDVTGASPDFASSFLEAAGWDVNQALDMYLGGGAAQAQNMTNRSTQRDEEIQGKLMEQARQIMEQQGVDQATALAIAEAQGPAQPQVRAPIAQTTARLIDNDVPGASGNLFTGNDFAMNSLDRDMAVLREQMRQNAAHGGFSVAFNQRGGNNINEATVNTGGNNLQALFSPPRELIFDGSWDEIKAEAKEASKWVLVNIQKDSEFLSYNLNRDLWSNEIIKELIVTTFVFFQHEHTDIEAQSYTSIYNPARFPHISIVDPFTGEQMLEIELAPYQHDSSDLLAAFLEATNNFLDNHVLEGEKLKKMQEKIKNRNLNQGKAKAKSPAIEEESRTEAQSIEDNEETDADIQMLSDIENLEDEPAPGKNVTTIQFRLFGKKTLKRRFLKTQKVKELFSFVRKEVEEARKKKFDLICYPQKSLKELLESTLVEERLVNTTLSAVFL